MHDMETNVGLSVSRPQPGQPSQVRLCQHSLTLLLEGTIGSGLCADIAGRSATVPKRLVGILLRFNLVHFPGTPPRDDARPRWEVMNWDTPSNKLCGSCSWCRLLVEGVYRRLPADILKFSFDPSPTGATRVEPPQLVVDLDLLEYHKDMSLWTTEEGHPGSCGLSLLLISGRQQIKSTDSVSASSQIVLPFEIFAAEDDPAVKHLSIHRRPLDSETLSDRNIDKMRHWLTDCERNHRKCEPDSGRFIRGDSANITRFVPTRLIDVGTESASPRLVETATWSPSFSQGSDDTNYIAFSYCWGPSGDFKRPLTTTHATIESRLRGIATDVMPLAFKDIVTLAKALGIRFVWIDSLCIVQDDQNDWQVESGMMADIFSEAYLTVVAAASSTSHESFLSRTTNPTICTLPFEHRSNNGSPNGSFSIRNRPGSKWWGSDKMAEISGLRWLDRGWTFQEERLARRVLIFGRNKFFFDCRTVEIAEDMNMFRARPDWSETIYETTRGDGHEYVTEADFKRQNHKTAFDHWQTLCDHYSRRSLTFPNDKLPAFSGIANKISKKIKSEYLAGMWRENLVHDLFWQTYGKAEHPETYCAPSWSWAALKGDIKWRTWRQCKTGTCEMYCNLIDAQTTIVGSNPFGAVRDGCLVISGAVIETELLRDDSIRNSKHHWRLVVNGVQVGLVNLDDGNPCSSKAWALLFAKCNENKAHPRGFILQKTNGSRNGLEEFQRQGIFRIARYYMVPTKEMPDVETVLDVWRCAEKQTIAIV